MATIRRYKDKWRAEVYSKGKRASKVFSKKTDANRWASQKQLELDAMADGVHCPERMSDAMQRYIDEEAPKRKGGRTEAIRVNRLMRSFLADLMSDEVKPADIQRWRDERLKTVSNSTVRREMVTLSCVFNACVEWGYCAKNPLREVKKPSESAPRDRRLSEEEIEKILFALEYEEGAEIEMSKQLVGAYFLLALETAMRLGELCSIEKENVDIEKRFITLQDTKNGSKRHVPLSNKAAGIVKQILSCGRRVSSGTASSIFRRAVVLSGIDNLHFHDTRHEALTRLARKLDVLDLARMVGHKDPRSLMIYYNATATEIASRLD